MSTPYGAEYYKAGFGTAPHYERSDYWLTAFGLIADRIVQLLHPASVFDAGCAWGFLVEALSDRGVAAQGRDLSEYAIGKVREDLRERCVVGSVADPITGGPFDLVTCIEVLEHIPEGEALRAIAHFAAATDAVLFSSAPDEFMEPTHINVHPVSYWLRAFQERGFLPDISFDASFLAPHAFLVRRRTEPVSFEGFARTTEPGAREAPGVPDGLAGRAGPVRAEDTLALFADTLQLRVQQANRYLRLRELEDENARLRLAVKDLEWRDRSRAAGARVNSLVSGVAGRMALRYSERYREWLNRNIGRKPWVRKYWEPSAVWMLQRIRRRRAAAHPAVDSRARVEIPAEAGGEYGYERWIRENEPGPAELEIQRRISACFSYRPKISVLMPVYKIPLGILREALNSVEQQTYEHWELCIAVTREEGAETLDYLQQKAAQDARFRVAVEAANEGISENTNRALALASGEYLALLDHDDTLAPFALFEVVELLNRNQTRADFIYSDRDEITEDGSRRVSPLFKPEWSPEVMLNANYLTQLSVMRTENVRACGGFRREMDGAQDWDLFLRVIARSRMVRHIPKVLYHWRQVKTSVSARGMAAKPYAAGAQVRAVEAYVKTLGAGFGAAQSDQGCRIKWPATEQRVSVVCVSQSPDGLAQAEKLAHQTDHPNFEIICASPQKPYGTRNVRTFEPGPGANLIESLEMAVRLATGTVLVFIDEAVEPGAPDWLVEITGPLAIPGAGVTGAKLVDAQTRLLRHCGLVITKSGRVESIYCGKPKNVSGPAGLATWYRNWSAVSGACLAMRREVWDAVGGSGGERAHARPDVDLCLKVHARTSWRVVYNPFAWMLQSREAALERPVEDWRGGAEDVKSYFPDGDPYFNPNLDCRDGRVVFDNPLRSDRRQGFDFATAGKEAERLVELCSRVEPEPGGLKRERKVALQRVMWFLPEFASPFDSEVHTILRFAEGFQRSHGVESLFCAVGPVPEKMLGDRVAAAFPELAARSRFFSVRDFDGVARLPETEAGADAAVCCSWRTAYAARHFRQAGARFYFLQDEEALAYPAGSIRALAEASWQFGYYGICNSIGVWNAYRAHGGEGAYFTPCVDGAVFHAGGRRATGAPATVFIDLHPGHPRTCFELVCAALRRVKQRRGDGIRAVAAGADWDPRDYGLDGVLHNPGALGGESLAALYRSCEAGVALSVTRHPSNVPLELMACGALVISNRNPDTAWLLEDGENCLLAGLSAVDLAGRIEEACANAPLRQCITERASELVQAKYSGWDVEIEKIYQAMLNRFERTDAAKPGVE